MAAVILMKDDLKDIEIINQSGTISDIEKIMGTLPLSPFNKDTINYLHILSKELNKHPMLKKLSRCCRIFIFL